jgi:DNA repair photolyase
MNRRPLDNPPNPFLSTEREYLEGMDPGAQVQVYEDHTREILASNDSPDLGFRWSVNPYRGCQHACAYCYARPTHEYLSFGAGTDFDTKIMVKVRAPELLREAFEKKSWKGETVVFSGVTDCYQPLEASYRITRACLEVAATYRNPIGVITKSPLVERDIDVLQQLVKDARAFVSVSIPFLDADHARKIEPWVAPPARRLRIIETLAKAGIPVGVMAAPVIPGLTDEEVPKILEAARDAGASRAGYVLLRLPGNVQSVFEARVRAEFPQRADKILGRLIQTRGGELYDPRFGKRQVGEGPYADAIATLFRTTAERLGLIDRRGHDGSEWTEQKSTFTRPARPGAQLALF